MSVTSPPHPSPPPTTTSPTTTSSTISLPLLITLALLSAAAPFATDLYLPAFPDMVSDLTTTTTGVQLSLTTFLIGAGIGQVVFGPLSDRVGRRTPLIVGSILYVLVGIGAAMAPTIGVLVALRFLQGLFGAAGMVIGRAIISDRAHGADAARAFSLMMLVGGMAPIVAPVLGSVLTETIGWRGLLWIVVALGVIAAVAVLVVVRETRTPEAIREEQTEGSTGVLRELTSRRYLGNALAYGFSFATMMAYISASPFLYQDMMGLSTLQYGLAFALNATALAVVSAVAAKLAARISAARLAGIGLGLNLLAILVLLAMVLADVTPVLLAAPILVAVASLGLVLGNTTALALDSARHAPGAASAVLGLLQFGLAGAVSPLVGIGGEQTALPLAVVMVVAAVVACAGFAIASRRSR
ncbi:MAG: multidrug effflux MFS transporter [Rhodococcus sp. (in: high G+C Gram-positive bacteria)]|uniref:multidrug effflux MFS transporter n=1 Tax=Rhodococcus sp. TaxID=1831 RepID=UPI003BB6C4C0